MKNLKISLNLSVLMLTLANASLLLAAGAGTSGGLTLIESPSAKFSAMGGAATAAIDEVSAFNENPAALQSLKMNQALFLYQKGLIEDSYGRFMIGHPGHNSSWGLSIGYYNAGEMELSDGLQSRTVTAQRDLAVTLGYSRALGKFDVGVAGKYLRSELIETYTAAAYAADLGFGYGFTSRFQLGAAVQNIGTKMTYLTEGDDLPRIARMGASYVMVPKAYKTTLYMDAPYYLNESQLRPALGLEVMVGMLALRAGFVRHGTANEFTMGTGFLMANTTLDYSIGVQQNVDMIQRISLSTKFGALPTANAFVQKPTPTVNYQPTYIAPAPTAYVPVAPVQPVQRRIYTVKEGDTLFTIAASEYGTRENWKLIYNANLHLLNTQSLTPGQKIVLP